MQRIGVFNVENSTVYELKSVTFGGLFQRTVFGVPEYDVHALLLGAIEEALLRKNYETLNLGAAPSATALSESGSEAFPSADSPAASPSDDVGRIHDAELTATIEFWKAERGARSALDMRFRVELYSAGEPVRLYAATGRAVYKEGPRTRSQPGLDKIIRPAVLRAFADLPPANASEGDDDSRNDE